MELALPMTEEDWNFQDGEPLSGRVISCPIESFAVLIVNAIVRALSLPGAPVHGSRSSPLNGRGRIARTGRRETDNYLAPAPGKWNLVGRAASALDRPK